MEQIATKNFGAKELFEKKMCHVIGGFNVWYIHNQGVGIQ